MRAITRAFPAFLLSVPVLACSGSSGSDGGSSTVDIADEEAAFGPAGNDYRHSYLESSGEGSGRIIESAPVGEIEIGGQTWLVVQSGTFEGEDTLGIETWIAQDGELLTIAGGEGYSPLIAPGPEGEAPLRIELPTPLTIDLGVPVGEPQTLSVTTPMVLAGNTHDATINGTYTLVSDATTVETPSGTIHGVRNYTFEITPVVPSLGFDGTDAITGEAWYSPERGVVAGSVELPGLGATRWGIQGTFDGALDGDTGRVERLDIVDGTRSFNLSTYDRVGLFEADKDRHAKMLLELRFVDEARARTTEQPATSPTFATMIGYYPSMLVSAPISFFHPFENGQGYTYWLAYVDQAARNESTNGIAYSISVPQTSDGAAVRATARIIYHVWNPQ